MTNHARYSLVSPKLQRTAKPMVRRRDFDTTRINDVLREESPASVAEIVGASFDYSGCLHLPQRVIYDKPSPTAPRYMSSKYHCAMFCCSCYLRGRGRPATRLGLKLDRREFETDNWRSDFKESSAPSQSVEQDDDSLQEVLLARNQCPWAWHFPLRGIDHTRMA